MRPEIDRLPPMVKEAVLSLLAKAEDALGSGCQIYLFGSYAKGDWLDDSDLDLIVVSERFEGLDLGRRYLMVESLLPEGLSLEVLTYTPKEFKRALKISLIIQDAMEYWIRLR